jgi:hypothetical protein
MSMRDWIRTILCNLGVVFYSIQQLPRLSNRTQSDTMPEVRAEWVGGTAQDGQSLLLHCVPVPADTPSRRPTKKPVESARACRVRRKPLQQWHRLAFRAQHSQPKRRRYSPPAVAMLATVYVIAPPGRQKGLTTWAPGEPFMAHRQFDPNWIPVQCLQRGSVTCAPAWPVSSLSSVPLYRPFRFLRCAHSSANWTLMTGCSRA